MENFIDWIIINLPFLCVVVLFIIRAIIATKRGMIKEICSVIATVVASLAVLLIAFAIRKYFVQDRIIFIASLILIVILGVLYKIVDGFLVTLKLVSKLPLIKYVDKVFGIIIALAEVVFVVWVVYCIVLILDAGLFESWVMRCVRNNYLMRVLFENNYLYTWISPISQTLRDIDIAGKIGL